MKPAEDETNAITAPSTAERPAALNAAAPRGISTTTIASEATEPVTPVSASTNVSHPAETRETTSFTAVLMSPLRSATATPSKTVITTPRGGKEAKFSTASPTMACSPSDVSRL